MMPTRQAPPESEHQVPGRTREGDLDALLKEMFTVSELERLVKYNDHPAFPRAYCEVPWGRELNAVTFGFVSYLARQNGADAAFFGLLLAERPLQEQRISEVAGRFEVVPAVLQRTYDLAAPTLKPSPSEVKVCWARAKVLMRWAAVPGASSYELMVGDSRHQVRDDTLKWLHVGSGQHLWLVRALDAQGRAGPWSDICSLNVQRSWRCAVALGSLALAGLLGLHWLTGPDEYRDCMSFAKTKREGACVVGTGDPSLCEEHDATQRQFDAALGANERLYWSLHRVENYDYAFLGPQDLDDKHWAFEPLKTSEELFYRVWSRWDDEVCSCEPDLSTM